jgi:hypothetical protein
MAGLRDSKEPARPVLRVSTDEPSSGYLAAVILDDYDGGVWSFDTTFRPTGGRIPAPAAQGVVGAGVVDVAPVRQRASLIASLPVPFLPAIDRPVNVAGLQVGADAATGMLLPIRTARGVTSYTVLSRAPTAALSRVASADGIGIVTGSTLPHAGTAAEPDLALPANTSTAMASALRFLSRITGLRPAPTVAFLQAMLASLHADEKRVDPTLPACPTQPGKKDKPVCATKSGGTSLAVVINAITNDRAATPEQFATLYAMVARYLGVPARLVTGFRLPTGSDTSPVPPGSYQLTSRQAWTWVEIPVAGIGWVVADPTPDGVTRPGAALPEPAQASANTPPPANQANAVPRNEITGGHAVAKPAPVEAPASHGLPWWAVLLAVLGGGLALVALLGPGLAAARRLLRRRARHQIDPSQLAVGAWLELLDGLEQAGMATGLGDTTVEVASEAGRHFGPDLTEPVQQVGSVAERAVFSVTGPPDEEAAQRAWETQRSVRHAVHGRLDRRQRVRALLAVGSAPRQPSGSDPARFRP